MSTTQANAADLNAYAAAAGYTELRLHDSDPGGDYTVGVHAGPYAISMGGAGVAGPSASLQPATDGRNYADAPVTVVLTVACGWASVRNSASGAVRTFELPRGPIGPGSFPLVYGVAVRAAD